MRHLLSITLTGGLLMAMAVAVNARIARPPVEPVPPSPDLTKAMQEIIDGKGKLDTLRLDVNWSGKSVTIYGNGVGIWNREKQFSLKKDQIVGLLKTMDKAKFGTMKAGYGGNSFPGDGPGRPGRPDAPVGARPPERLIGGITLTIDGVTKSVHQLGGGEQSKELAELSAELLKVCEEAAKDGVGAKDLADGLAKIVKKELMPEVLALMVQRIENEGIGPNGWIMRLNGRTLEVQVRDKNGISPPYRLELAEKELAEVCKLLTDADPVSFPVNLWAEQYTDFNVELFKHNKNLQARKFAKMTKETHGEKQKKFDTMFEGLEKLQARAVKEGKQNKN